MSGGVLESRARGIGPIFRRNLGATSLSCRVSTVNLAEKLFAAAVAVDPGRVKEVATKVDRALPRTE
jgi:hypothetical protein